MWYSSHSVLSLGEDEMPLRIRKLMSIIIVRGAELQIGANTLGYAIGS